MSNLFNKIDLLQKSLPVEFTAKEAKLILSPYYKAPIKVLETMVFDGDLIRLKKGLYVWKDRFDPMAAAGNIHGPSYVSFETALAFYNLIPERVTSIVSVVDNRQIRIKANGVLFIYRSQDRELFSAGMSAIKLGDRNVLIATPEKALLDTIAWAKVSTKNLNQRTVYEAICESYRFNEDDLFLMNRKHLRSLAELYRSRAPSMFVDELSKQKELRKRK